MGSALFVALLLGPLSMDSNSTALIICHFVNLFEETVNVNNNDELDVSCSKKIKFK